MKNIVKFKWYWKKFRKGRGIKVELKGDFDKNGQQKYRPGIITKVYPTHVKVQLMSSQASEYDAFSIKINNKIQYIRPIYFRTVDINDVKFMWKDEKGEIIEIDKKSDFFKKVRTMEYQESLEQDEGNLDMKDEMIKNQLLEIKQLKDDKKIDRKIIEKLTLEIKQLKSNQIILESENEIIKNQLKEQNLSEYENE